ncbi:MAG: hypothetical protein NT154_15150 [Verrucomicrobia bacterium]|nr:hypothetical protein [Verrucomicrobiota bacterium]
MPYVGYDKRSHLYWMKERCGDYVSIFEEGVDYAGPLSGFRAGLHQVGTRKLLVTRSYTLIKPRPGDHLTIDAILDGMFGEEQCMWFLAWLKLAYESLKAGRNAPGQAMVLAGPIATFKSFLQHCIITLVLGGRSSKCYKFLSGRSDFNGDMFEAEHLIIDDDVPSTTYQGRSSIAANIKSIVASELQSCHAKFKDAISLTPFWRLTISVNDNPEALQVLPVLDPSLEDKLLLFKVREFEPPMPTVTHEERAAFRVAVHAELPALIHDLLQWEIPPHMAGRRFGILHYHHPEVLEALREISQEERLLSIIDAVIFAPGHPVGEVVEPEPWVGAAVKLEHELLESDFKREVDKILCFPNACGTLLGRLKKQRPERIAYLRSATVRNWRITPPQFNE